MKELTTNNRIDLVDCLRGFAVCGIIMIHFLEHMNFMTVPKPTALDQGIWDTVFFLGASKMHARFALLFGFCCYIRRRGALTSVLALPGEWYSSSSGASLTCSSTTATSSAPMRRSDSSSFRW